MKKYRDLIAPKASLPMKDYTDPIVLKTKRHLKNYIGPIVPKSNHPMKKLGLKVLQASPLTNVFLALKMMFTTSP